MSPFIDFCIDCREAIPATENSHIDKPGGAPRCAKCAAEQDNKAAPQTTHREMAFSMVKAAVEAFLALSNEPGFHSALWQDSFAQMFSHIEALDAPGNNLEDIARIAIMWIKAINLAIEELAGVVESTILVGQWMGICHRLRWADDYFQSVLAGIYDRQMQATEEV
jgi:hypothetical protein